MQDLKIAGSEPLVDPDAFDLVLQALAALSSVSTLAVSWMQVRLVRGANRTAQNQEVLRQQLRTLERGFEDLFEEIRSALKIMESAYQREHGSTLLDQSPRFGSRINLTPNEMQSLAPIWQQISAHFMNVRTSAFVIPQLLIHTSYPGEDSISNDLEDMNEKLNGILFNSKSFEESFDRLNELRQRASGFLRRLRSLEN